MKKLVIYPGRFQPFHKGHAQVYQWLKNKFGDAYIATSDKVEAPKSPFNFKEKKQMMRLAGVPAGKIKQVLNPYMAREILKDFDPKTTVLIFAVSQKDMEEDPRFSFKPTQSGKPGYLQPYAGNEKNLKPFGDVTKMKGYVIVTPTFTFDVLGQPATSASELRKQFVSLDNKKQKDFIKDLFGKYDESVHKLMNTKLKAMMGEKKSLKKLKEQFNIGLTYARKEMPQVGASRTFVQYMKNNGIDSMRRKIDPAELKSSQMEFDRSKIEGLKEKPSSNPIVVSNDGYVLDGHHRWLADSEMGRKCDSYVVDLPILDLLHKAKHYTAMELNEEITRKQLAPMLDSFVSFASDKLGLKSMPTVRYKTDDDDYNSFAAYNPSSNELSIHTMNRHPMDIFRSVAHELVHHKQNEDGKLGKDIEKEGATGSDIENEANSEAGKIMRWFAKTNPDMFGQSFVVENNTASMGGVRGLGNVTGEVSPTVTSQYVLDNMANTNNTEGLWFDDGVKSYWLDKKGSGEYKVKATKGFKAVRSQLNEGINDPGRLKAVFLAGGPGSGKDFVMNKALAGNGLREINSDTAFEFLMKRNNLDLEMPDEERVEREIVRGRAKNITSRKEINSLSGRLGLIVNGTADDLEKIKTVKAELEDLGYDTMMVFVNTSNEVSRQRNVERGKSGNRKVPDGTDKQGNPDDSPNIRQEKWDLAQENLGELEKIFGKDSFAVIDNTADIRKVAPDVKERIEADFNRVRRMTMQFVQSPVKNKRGQAWTQRRARYQGTTQYAPPTAYTRPEAPKRIETPKAITKPSSALMDQARRLGLSYYGFGRFGRKVGGKNKVLYHSKGNQLVKVQTMNEEKKMKNPCWKGYRAYGMKKKNGREVPNCVPVDEAFEEFAEANGKKKKKKNKALNQEAMGAPEPWGYNFGDNGIGPTAPVPRAGTPYGFGYGSAYSMGLSESIEAWMRLERTQQKFVEKYGNLWEEKLIEAAHRLEEAGCGCNHSEKKSMKKLREGMEGGVNNMGTVPTQRKGDQEANEESEDVIDTSKIKSLKAYKKNIHPQSETEKESLKEGTPAWQRKEGKDPKGGLNRKGIASYRRANPGSKLSMAVTTKPSKLKKGSKAANRRKSFCARMGGMKKRLTSAKTARDPNSRINKSLRKWNCEE